MSRGSTEQDVDGWLSPMPMASQPHSAPPRSMKRSSDWRRPAMSPWICRSGFSTPAVPGGRECERLGRRMLGRRASSIFSSPCRAALACPDHPSASRTNRESSPHGLGLSRQAHAIFPKMREIDAIVTPDLQERLFEIHPELCFVEMALIENVEAPAGKKTSAGVEQRMALLEAVGFAASSLCDHRRSWGASRDDVLDAAAAAWTALRRAQGLARFLPHTPPTDARGLRMEMWI